MFRNSKLKILGGFVVAICGTATVCGLMIAMNNMTSPPEKNDDDGTQKFQVTKPPEPPPKKKKSPPKRKQMKSVDSNAAPPPSLNSAIGSVGIDLPGFAPTEMGGASKKLLGDVKSSVMTADSVDEKPRPMHQPQPKLPARVVQKQVEGKVVIRLLVDEDGRVERIKIMKAEPQGLFEEPVKEAAKQWRYQPAQYQGKPVKTWIEVPMNFKLG
jgi:protein TonB